MKPEHPIRVLSISDEPLPSARDIVLGKNAGEMVSISTDALLDVQEIRSFDMAIVSPTLPAQRSMAIIDRLRRYNPGIHIVRPVVQASAESSAAPARKPPASERDIRNESRYFA